MLTVYRTSLFASISLQLPVSSVGDPNPNPNPKGSECFEGSESKSESDQTVRIRIRIRKDPKANFMQANMIKRVKSTIFDVFCEEKL